MIEPKIIGNDCLVLNSDGMPISYLPISTCSWREAVTDAYLDNVVVLHTHADWMVRSSSFEMEVPSVIMKKKWARKGRTVKLTRNHVFLRDRYTCQYCNNSFARTELTIDHWIPKVAGGGNEWENMVTACKSCNGMKGHSKGWIPNNLPYVPTYGELTNCAKSIPILVRDLTWNLYLGWDESLIGEIPKKLITT